jgi:ribonucleoside-triphosphate reductase
MPRLAYLAKDKEDFYKRLGELMDISARSLKIKRDVCTKALEQGLYPYTKRYLGHFDNHFSTIGLVGMNEACLNANWLKKDLTHEDSVAFSIEVLNFMRNRLSDYQELYGDLYNLEATPAESTAYRLAKHDVDRYPDIITARSSEGTPYYTNSSHLPVGYTESVSEALNIQDELQTLYTSGTVFHTFLGQRLPSWQVAATIVRKIAENYRLPYFTMSPTYSICKDHGYLVGEVSVCPHCGKSTEVYSRITGYYRPIKNWNDGKIAEFKNRKEYRLGEQISFETPLEKKEKVEAVEKMVSKLPKEGKRYVLFVTHTCPNCRLVKVILDDHHIEYEEVYADDNMELAKEHNIRSVPTLLVVDEGKTYDTYSNYSEIAQFISQQA